MPIYAPKAAFSSSVSMMFRPRRVPHNSSMARRWSSPKARQPDIIIGCSARSPISRRCPGARDPVGSLHPPRSRRQPDGAA